MGFSDCDSKISLQPDETDVTWLKFNNSMYIYLYLALI